MGFLDGKVALVTGGGGGVGRSIALELARQGAAVAVDDVARDKEGMGAADKTVREIELAGGAGLALHEDVTNADGARAMVDAVVNRFGRIDILVMSAGNAMSGRLHELTEEQWDFTIGLHLRGHFLCCKMALPHMLKQNSGRILTIGSRGAFFQVPASKKPPRSTRRPPCTVYSTVKAGILGLTTTLAVELWETGITVNCLMPSASTGGWPSTTPRRVGGLPPTQSLDPDDLAPAAAYLCTPQASDISGKLMYASGGDVAFFGEQLSVAGACFLRKKGRWTVEELEEVVPSVLGLESA